jgi:hypothetical protein
VARLNTRSQLACLWAGPAAAVIFAIGFWAIAKFIPPPSPTHSPQTVVALFAHHTLAIRIGMLVTQLSMALLLPWGIAVAVQTKRIEGSTAPVMSWVQVASVAVGTTIVVLMTVVWETAAFRPTTLSPQIVQAFNDFGWFILLFDWIPFAIWAIAMGVPIISDHSDDPVFPRWAAYVCFFTAFVFYPAGMMAFFKTGPFAWSGVLAFYVPVIAFFIWLAVMTALSIRAVRRQASAAALHHDAGVQVEDHAGLGVHGRVDLHQSAVR